MHSTQSRAVRRLMNIKDMTTDLAMKTVVYKTVDDVQIPFDIYLPPGAKHAPVLLWFHGGTYRYSVRAFFEIGYADLPEGGLLQGRRDKIPAHFLDAMTKYHFAFISADYRLAPQVGIAEIVEDVKDCIAFIRSPDGLSKKLDSSDTVDPSRLAVSGGSAGGYLAFFAGLYAEPKPQVILPIYPITDPLGTFFVIPRHNPVGDDVQANTVAEFMDPKGPVVANNDPASARSSSYFWMMQEGNLARLLGITEQAGEAQDRWRIPRSIRKHGLPPTFAVHGDADRFVGVEQCDEAIGVMAGEGLTYQYERRHDADHLFDMQKGVDMSAMYEFMMKYL